CAAPRVTSTTWTHNSLDVW
nr:immunoglobulin heavy chain junction region [Macaca mulatta]MOV48506.1 immunoglobulin heavy chain junction region [Macaca mulatta]